MQGQPEEELRNKVESILFSAGKKVELAEIAKLCGMSHNLSLVERSLVQLKEKYASSPIMLVQEGTLWKMTVREKYVPVVQKIVTQSELSKTLMETLAVIAYKAPVLQSDVIKTRTNKAYDHLAELEKQGYISREKKGRTKLIRLSPKFFDYFDIPPDKVKERFRQIEDLEKAVALKESEARELKHAVTEKDSENRKRTDLSKKKIEEELGRVESEIVRKEENLPEIDLVDEKGRKKKLDVYDSEIAEGTEFEEPKANITVVKETLGDLEIVREGADEDEKKQLVEEAERLEDEDEEYLLKQAEEKLAEKEKKEKFTLFREEVAEAAEVEGEAAAESPESGDEAAAEGEAGEGQPEASEEEEAAVPEEPPAAGREPLGKPPLEPAESQKRSTAAGIIAEARESAQKKPVVLKEGRRLFEKGMPKGMESRVEERVDEIVYGRKPAGQGPEGEGGKETAETEGKKPEKQPAKEEY